MPPLSPEMPGNNSMRSFRDRCRALVWAVAVLVALVTAAQAGPYEDALAHFTTDSFSDTDRGHQRRRAQRQSARRDRHQGPAGRPAVLQRRRQERLLQGRSPTSCSTRRPAKPSPERRPAISPPVRLNNRLRGMVAAALGSLTLMSPDPAKRLQAAQAVFKSRDPNALATLDAAHPEGDRRPRQAGADRGARRGRALFRQRVRGRQARSRRGRSASAATRMRSRCSAACRPTRRRR